MKKFLVTFALVIFMLCMSCVNAEDVKIGEPFTVQIMGNANLDEVVDQQDIEYIQGILGGKQKKTELADANNDGNIDQSDIDQVRGIISGTEDIIYFVNCKDEIESVKHPLNDVIVVYDNTAEIIRILGAQDKVVGVDSMIIDKSTYFPEFSQLPSIGERKDCNIEKILELNPDAVFIHTKSDSGCPDLEEKLKDKGINVVRLSTWESHTAVPSLMLMAYMLDKVDRARDYVSYQEKYLKTVKERVSQIPEEKRLNVFIDRPGDTTTAKGSGYSESVEFAGGVNIAKNIAGGFDNVLPAVDAEWVVKENPDVIIGLSWDGGHETDDINVLKKRYDEILTKPGFSSIDAVKNGRVYITPYINVLGPGYHIGLIQFAKWLYPDQFSDLDVKLVQDEYMTNWQNLYFDLNNHGVFGYPVAG